MQNYFLIMCLASFQTALSSSLESNSHNETGGGPGPGQGPPEILLMGNSYVSSNSLHNLLSTLEWLLAMVKTKYNAAFIM
jgi:hypothetical protein